MRISIPSLLGVLALAACAPMQPDSEDPAVAPDTPVSSAAPPEPPPRAGVVTPHELFGQWRLVSLTGASLADQPPIHLLIGAARIEAVSQCIPFAFSFVDFDQGRVRIRGEPWPDPVCERGRSQAEQLFPALMAASRRVVRQPGGRIAFVGTMGEAVIERPAEPPTNPFGNTPGPEPGLMWGTWSVESINGEPMPSEAIRLNFYHRAVEAQSGCISLFWSLDPAAGTMRFEREDSPGPMCERALSRAETALIAAFDGAVRIEPLSPLRRRLTGRGGTVELRR